VRVAHFVQRYPPALGGSEAYFARLSRYLAGRGDAVTVFTTTAIDLEGLWHTRGRGVRPGVTQEDGIGVRRYRPVRCAGLPRLLRLLRLIPHRGWQCLSMSCNPVLPRMWLDAGQRTPPFDVVHATAFPYGWLLACGLRLARRQGVPFVVTPFLHLGDPTDPRDRTRRAYLHPALLGLLHAADRIFVQTGVERDALLQRGLAQEKVVLQGLGVEPAECTGGDRDRVRCAWGVAANEVVIGHLANNSREKGTVDLLRAAERAWQRGARFRLALAGPEMPNFKSFWQSYRCGERVRRLGVLDDRQKRDFFAGIDLFALPSRSDSFGLVLLEAWANGVPNVAYRGGGVADVIRHEQDGLLVDCGDLEGLATTLTRLAENRELRSRFGAAGQERLAREFRWEDKLALVRRVYEELHVSPTRQRGPSLAGASG
jgi:glycosyltransferase involved in cell wall biosynthesis